MAANLTALPAEGVDQRVSGWGPKPGHPKKPKPGWTTFLGTSPRQWDPGVHSPGVHRPQSSGAGPTEGRVRVERTLSKVVFVVGRR